MHDQWYNLKNIITAVLVWFATNVLGMNVDSVAPPEQVLHNPPALEFLKMVSISIGIVSALFAIVASIYVIKVKIQESKRLKRLRDKEQEK